MRLSLIIPTFRRPQDLQRCLAALKRQSFVDIEILCVCRPTDENTRQVVRDAKLVDSRLREILVEKSGVIAAMNAGFSAVDPSAEFVAFTDDDTEAPPDWLRIVVNHLDAHPSCGAVGGQDRLQLDIPALRNPPIVDQVGTFSWTGGFHATHHCPISKDFVKSDALKGVNMTYRHALIRGVEIGQGLTGGGTQVGWELSLSSRVHSRGMEIHFVRDAWLLHYGSPRSEQDDRLDMETDFARHTTRNQVFVTARYLPAHITLASLLRQVLVGSRFVPGILRLPFHPDKWRITFRHFPYLIAGMRDGIKSRLLQNP